MRLPVRSASLLVVSALLASACSSSHQATTDDAAPEGVPTEPAIATTAPLVPADPDATETPVAVGFAATVEFLDEASERMRETPHRFETFFADVAMEEMELEGPVMAGESDGMWASATLAGPSLENGGLSATGERVANMISNGVDTYMYSPGLSSFPAAMLDPIAQAVANGWILVKGAEIEERVGVDLVPTMSPSTFVGQTDMWEALRDARSISEGPRSAIRGTETRTIVAEVNRPAGSPFRQTDGVGSTDGPASTIVIHIDTDGYVRAIVEEFGRMEFFDIGADDIAIELPPDVTDMTAEWIAVIESQLSPGTPMTEAEIAELEEQIAAHDAQEAAEAAEEATEPGLPTVPQVLVAQPELSLFWSLLEASGLDEIFGDVNDPWTVLAPTNFALDARREELAAVVNDPTRLNSFVSRHLIPGAYDEKAMLSAGSLQPLEGASISVASQGSGVVLDGSASVLLSDLPTVSGFVHVLPRAIE